MIKLEQYRDVWLAEKMAEVIGFYPREFYPLDNFSSFKVEWNGYLYASVEEVNKLEWVDVNDNFFDMNKYAGEGNIGHIIEEIKFDIQTNK